ncbi:MAG: hypothetical protein GX975_02675 [Clostridiales bacterium]|nr:hypothetical protein [Clostridiales bacterium]
MPDLSIVSKIGIAVMIVAGILSHVYSRKHQKQVRIATNEFALAFIKISNLVCPSSSGARLELSAEEEGQAAALPYDLQGKRMRNIIDRTKNKKIDKYYEEMQDAIFKLKSLTKRTRRFRKQFTTPIEEMFGICRTFLVGCENLDNIKGEQAIKDFESFLCEQEHHRKELFKRISAEAGEEFSELSKNYEFT